MKVSVKFGASWKVFVLALLFFGWVGSLTAQSKTETAKYEILVLGIKIGNMTAQKMSAGDSARYTVDSQVKFWFFGDVEVKLLTRAHFSGGKIAKTFSESKTNRGNFSSKVNWKGAQYAVDAKSYKYSSNAALKGPLMWCSSKLFFHEPTGQELFLSEVYGVVAPIKKISPGVYEVQVEGNINRYHYQGGKLTKIVVQNTIKDYQVKLIK
jgi:hypothetical protein